MAPRRTPAATRLKERSIEQGDCLVYTGQKDRDGYGLIGIGRRTQFRAHRIAWELANGRPVPAGMMVCHSCDNPPCINPSHLFIGTAKDNTADMMRKKRRPILAGEHHPSVKLTDLQVQQIRERRSNGEPLNAIAKDFGISFQHVSTLYLRGRKETSCHT